MQSKEVISEKDKAVLRAETKAVYEKGARDYAKKFENIGARVEDVDLMIALSGQSKPSIVEIGCGNGREAAYILSKVANDHYFGFDISEEMIAMSRERLPNANFEVADVIDYEFPPNTDIVCAFASLLHSDKEEVRAVLERIHSALSEDGIVYISLKRRERYQDEVGEDDYGRRHFYYYTREAILEAAGDGYEEISYEEQELLEDWFTIVLRKK